MMPVDPLLDPNAMVPVGGQTATGTAPQEGGTIPEVPDIPLPQM